jgi:hypothetical protein
MECKQITFSGHALQRAFEREIPPAEVKAALKNGKVIADYPDDKPYPSCLLLYFTANEEPIHVVCAFTLQAECIVVTVYRPKPEQWNSSFTKKIKS